MKKLKIIGIIFITIIVCYILYVVIELIRFNISYRIQPLINLGNNLGPIVVDAGSNETEKQEEKMYGLGFTIEYEYIVHREENSDYQGNEVVGGKFKLFDKINLSDWDTK